MSETPNCERLCVVCRHFHFYGGEAGYSELTPGADASMDCDKGLWGGNFNLQDIHGPQEYRALIRRAANCGSFEAAVDA